MKNFRIVMIFHSGEVTADNITIYPLTETGLAGTAGDGKEYEIPEG